MHIDHRLVHWGSCPTGTIGVTCNWRNIFPGLARSALRLRLARKERSFRADGEP